jgi:hypothetical protein
VEQDGCNPAQSALRDGTTTVASTQVTNGGFIVALQDNHDSLIGLDANGKPIETLDATGWTRTFCQQETGCP